MNLNLLLCAAFLFITAGCINLKQPSINVDYYQIEYRPMNLPAPEPLDVVVGVRSFKIAAAYDHDRMVYKEDTFERQTYYYHRWITNPAEMVQNALLKDLQHSGNYRAVTPVPGSAVWDYEIQGFIHEIYESNLSKDWEAVIDLEITLIKTPPTTSKKKVLFQKNYRTTVTSDSKDPKAVVAAMSSAVQVISIELQKDIYKAVQDDVKEAKDAKDTKHAGMRHAT